MNTNPTSPSLATPPPGPPPGDLGPSETFWDLESDHKITDVPAHFRTFTPHHRKSIPGPGRESPRAVYQASAA
jgi:hypothetical protein